MPNTAMATAIDLYAPGLWHLTGKDRFGGRLARAALGAVCGVGKVCMGPPYAESGVRERICPARWAWVPTAPDRTDQGAYLRRFRKRVMPMPARAIPPASTAGGSGMATAAGSATR